MVGSEALISVVIPTKDRACLLHRSIGSALDQTYRNIEVIVIDDASVDETIESVQRWQDADERIRLVSQEVGAGAAIARNHAVSIAEGHFVAFLDDDDVWHPRKLEIQSRYLDVCPALGTRVSSGGPWKVERELSGRCSQVSLQDIWLRNGGMSPSSFICRRDLFLAVGGFSAELKANQGKDLFLKIFREIRRLRRVEDPLVYQDQSHSKARISDNWIRRIEANRYLQSKHADMLTERTRNLLRLRELRNMKYVYGRLSAGQRLEAIVRMLVNPSPLAARYCWSALV